jgi:hypothetical protein
MLLMRARGRPAFPRSHVPAGDAFLLSSVTAPSIGLVQVREQLVLAEISIRVLRA